MAKETTDVFDVITEFENSDEKLRHMLRIFNKTMTVDQLESDDLGDLFKIRLAFKDTKEKWMDLFAKGEWVKTYKILKHSSTNLGDEFRVEAVYKGGQKEFKKSFHQSAGYSRKFKFQANLVSSKTANLGVLNPYGKKVSKSQQEVLNIFRVYFIDILTKAGFTKKSKIPEGDKSSEFSVSIIGGDTYHSKYRSRLVCIHLAGWKIGILPKEGDEERFTILVSSQTGYKYGRNKNASFQVVRNDFGIPGRVKQAPDPKATWRKITSYAELFLGDPSIDKTMATFFSTISKTSIVSGLKLL